MRPTAPSSSADHRSSGRLLLGSNGMGGLRLLGRHRHFRGHGIGRCPIHLANRASTAHRDRRGRPFLGYGTEAQDGGERQLHVCSCSTLALTCNVTPRVPVFGRQRSRSALDLSACLDPRSSSVPPASSAPAASSISSHAASMQMLPASFVDRRGRRASDFASVWSTSTSFGPPMWRERPISSAPSAPR